MGFHPPPSTASYPAHTRHTDTDGGFDKPLFREPSILQSETWRKLKSCIGADRLIQNRGSVTFMQIDSQTCTNTRIVIDMLDADGQHADIVIDVHVDLFHLFVETLVQAADGDRDLGAQTHIHTHTHARTHARTHAHTHTHTHTHTPTHIHQTKTWVCTRIDVLKIRVVCEQVFFQVSDWVVFLLFFCMSSGGPFLDQTWIRFWRCQFVRNW